MVNATLPTCCLRNEGTEQYVGIRSSAMVMVWQKQDILGGQLYLELSVELAHG